MQKQFHESFLQAVALHLYKDDPEVDMDKIMSMNEWPNLKQQVLCLTPRRFGKTTAVAMFVAGYFLSVEKAQLCIFSTGKRASDGMLDKIHEFIKLIDEQRHKNRPNRLWRDKPLPRCTDVRGAREPLQSSRPDSRAQSPSLSLAQLCRQGGLATRSPYVVVEL